MTIHSQLRVPRFAAGASYEIPCCQLLGYIIITDLLVVIEQISIGAKLPLEKLLHVLNRSLSSIK